MAFMGVMAFVMIMLIIGVIVLIASVVILLVSWSKYKKNYALEQRMKSATPAVGTIMDCRQLHGSGKVSPMGKVKNYQSNAYAFLYEFSVAYPCSDGMQHIAFFGLRCKTPLPFQIADSVSVRMFPQPLQPIPQWVMDENRAVEGYLPKTVYYNAWQGVPVDETATVMLEADYENLQKRFRRKRRVAFVFLMICMVLLIYIAVTVGTVFITP